MSEQFAYTADAEGPPRLRFYIYQTGAGPDGRPLWMFTVDEYDALGRSSPLAERIEPSFKDIMAAPAEFTSEILEWRTMSGGEPVDLHAIAARMA